MLCDIFFEAEKDIYRKMQKSPYRNYLNKKRPKEHSVVYMMCVDETSKIEKLSEEIKGSDVYEELKILTYPSDDYIGYSYIKIYNKNASVQNMIDYLGTSSEVKRVITFNDNNRNKADYIYASCDRIVHKMYNMFNWYK